MTDALPLTEDERIQGARRAALKSAGLVVASYIPFGLAAGAAMGATSVDPLISILSSPIIFAGAAQIAAVQLLHVGAALALVVFTVAVINARHLLYSAAMAPHMADWSVGQRLAGAYLLADPVYALAAARFDTPDGGGASVSAARSTSPRVSSASSDGRPSSRSAWLSAASSRAGCRSSSRSRSRSCC